ncbi:MAG: hypothetical protein WC408_03465 [Candidatus Micrarchaeia archaeon]|jgi:hypothetical protein
MRQIIAADDFLLVLSSKKRETVYTKHAIAMAQKRGLPESAFEEDIKNQRPTIVIEQESEVACERKFDVYYLQEGRTFHRYVIALNNMMRVITLLRTNKDVQRKIADGKA